MSYIHHIRPFNLTEDFKVKMMGDEQYDATKLISKLSKED
jgi:hypothetical protein